MHKRKRLKLTKSLHLEESKISFNMWCHSVERFLGKLINLRDHGRGLDDTSLVVSHWPGRVRESYNMCGYSYWSSFVHTNTVKSVFKTT